MYPGFANSFVQISRNCKPSPVGTYKRRNLRNSYGSGMRSWRIARQHERHRDIKVSSSTGPQCQFIGIYQGFKFNAIYMRSTPSLNLDCPVERQNRKSITWNYMTLYEMTLISIKEQAGKKRTVGTHTNTNCLLKKTVHNKYIVYQKVKHSDEIFT